MSEQENYNQFRRIPEEIINTGNVALADELITADYIEHDSVPGFPLGVEGFKQYVQVFRAAFPDLHYTVMEDLSFMEGDKVGGALMGHGTMKGDLLGMPASGKEATWMEMHIGRYHDGKLVEHWANVDQMSMFVQLGFAPAPGGGG